MCHKAASSGCRNWCGRGSGACIIKDFSGLSNYNTNQYYNFLNLKLYSPSIINNNNLDNSIKKLKKNSKLISLVFSKEKLANIKNKSRNNIIRNYDREYKTHYF